MTNEEAIEILRGAIKKPNTKDGYLGQAITMAIEALEEKETREQYEMWEAIEEEEAREYFERRQESCEDCISRESVMVRVKEYFDNPSYDEEMLFDDLVYLPSVTPQPITLEKAIDYLHETGWMQEHDKEMAQPRWIPASERLPENNENVIVTDDACGLALVGIDWFDSDGSRWWCSQNVTAWMPLPEPYQGGESE